MALRCSRCKKHYEIGYYPFCPHDKVPISIGKRWNGFEPYIDQHVAQRPVEVTSPGHRDQLMRENGMEVRPREHIEDLNARRASKGMAPVKEDGTGYAS